MFIVNELDNSVSDPVVVMDPLMLTLSVAALTVNVPPSTVKLFTIATVDAVNAVDAEIIDPVS